MTDLEARKEKVVQGCRMLEMLKLIEYSGHISLRLPDGDRFLIHPRQTSRARVSTKDILVVDLQGRVLEGEEESPSETPLHAMLYRARPEVQSVAHLHSFYFYATLFSVAPVPLRPAHGYGAGFAQGVPVYPRAEHIDTQAKGEELARVLGNRRAALLKGHGAVVVGQSIEEVFFASVHLEENARFLLEAYRLGEPAFLTGEEVEGYLQRSWNPRGYRKVWDYYLSVAQRQGLL